MTTPGFVATPCDLCGSEDAILSVMMLADYQQMRVGPLCAPKFLRGTADELEQLVAAAVAEEQQQQATAAAASATDDPADGDSEDG